MRLLHEFRERSLRYLRSGPGIPSDGGRRAFSLIGASAIIGAACDVPEPGFGGFGCSFDFECFSLQGDEDGDSIGDACDPTPGDPSNAC